MLFKKYLKRAAAVALGTLTIAAALTGCNGANVENGGAAAEGDAIYRTLDEIKEAGSINIGVFSDKSPFGYVDENGKYRDMMYILLKDLVRTWV